MVKMQKTVILTNLASKQFLNLPPKLKSLIDINIVSSIHDMEDLADLLPKVEVLWIGVHEKVDATIVRKFPKLKVLATSSTGLTHIDKESLSSGKISLVSLKNEREFLISITATSELAWGLFIAAHRRILIADRRGHFSSSNRNSYFSRQIKGMSIGIIGLGRIGSHVANYALAFGAKVSYTDIEEVVSPNSIKYQSLEDLCRGSDAIFVTSSTGFAGYEPILGAKEISWLKENVILVNVSRGGQVNETELLKALSKKEISGYATDVLQLEETTYSSSITLKDVEESVRRGDNLLVTPHIGGACDDALYAVNEFILEKIFVEIKKLESIQSTIS
jgi:D-3-phosphoglycerate dehydrogenase